MKVLTLLGPFGIGGGEMGIIAFLLILGLGALVLHIFYLLMLQRTLELVSPELRKMSPGTVWLVFIPLFGMIWNFIMVANIADSLRSEFYKRNLPSEEERPGYSVGLAMCILPLIGFIPFIGFIASIGGLVCWITYWTKIRRYKTMLEQSSPYQQFQQHSYQYNPQQQNPYNNYQSPPNPNQQNPYQQNPQQNPENTPPPFNGPQP